MHAEIGSKVPHFAAGYKMLYLSSKAFEMHNFVRIQNITYKASEAHGSYQ